MITIFILFKLLRNIARPFIRGRTRAGAGRHRTTTRTAWKYSPPNPEKLQRQAEKARKEQFNRMQAAADMVHYRQVMADLLKAYDASGAADGDSEKAIRKRIQYDNAIRRTEKQIEKAAYNARR